MCVKITEVINKFVEDATNHPGWSLSIGALILTIFTLILTTYTTASNISEATDNVRKQYAIDLIIKWNTETADKKKNITAEFPDLFLKKQNKESKLCSDRNIRYWRSLYTVNSENVKRYQLKDNIVWMLNYFEAVVAAYNSNIEKHRSSQLYSLLVL